MAIQIPENRTVKKYRVIRVNSLILENKLNELADYYGVNNIVVGEPVIEQTESLACVVIVAVLKPKSTSSREARVSDW